MKLDIDEGDDAPSVHRAALSRGSLESRWIPEIKPLLGGGQLRTGKSQNAGVDAGTAGLIGYAHFAYSKRVCQ